MLPILGLCFFPRLYRQSPKHHTDFFVKLETPPCKRGLTAADVWLEGRLVRPDLDRHHEDLVISCTWRNRLG